MDLESDNHREQIKNMRIAQSSGLTLLKIPIHNICTWMKQGARLARMAARRLDKWNNKSSNLVSLSELDSRDTGEVQLLGVTLEKTETLITVITVFKN